MSESLTLVVFQTALGRIAARMEAVAAELNALDAAVGDGDLGVTLVRGMRAIVERSATFPDDIGLAFAECATGFTRTSGSTFGTLLATGLLAMGKATIGRHEISWPELAVLLAVAQDAMSSRGKSQVGDKTVIDAIDAIRQVISGESDPARMLALAAAGLNGRLETLRSQPARQGRARIFATRTTGLDDPGMIAIQRVLEALQ